MSDAMPTCGTPPAIAILCHGGGGGSTHAAMNLAAALDRRGRRVVLATLGRPLWPVPAGLDHIVIGRGGGGGTGRLDTGWDEAALDGMARAVARLCRRTAIDILHYHYALPFAAVAARVQGWLGADAPALVATLHGSDVTAIARNPGLGRPLAAAAAVSTVSLPYARMLAAATGMPEPAVVPNFLPAAPAARPRPPVRRLVPTIIHVSSFRPVKDTRAVARIFLAIRRQVRCRLVLVGDGPDRRGMRQLLRARAGDVSLSGFRRDVAALLRAADLMLLASRAESFGLAALEAMAAGVPVVAPRVGGLPAVVGDGVGGRLFHPGRHADATARAVALLLAPIHRRRMADRARRRAATFSEERAIAGYDRLYALALARTPAVAG
ncbi:N-acetyl-alpha-D-glucosaminyl L-malate synthase BshA [Allostella humosa]|nr:N-acetyl-alpha-D-glucosaminyl L-malate synthase BshA [Stella humosa]